jgi:hypothetical protein
MFACSTLSIVILSDTATDFSASSSERMNPRETLLEFLELHHLAGMTLLKQFSVYWTQSDLVNGSLVLPLVSSNLYQIKESHDLVLMLLSLHETMYRICMLSIAIPDLCFEHSSGQGFGNVIEHRVKGFANL